MAVKKKAAPKKKAAAKKAAAAAPKKAATKTEILNNLSEATGLTKKDVGAVFDAMSEMINKEINPRRRGPGVFNIPGLMKIKVVKKPATKARKGINPFTGEEMMFKAKPARNTVKVLPLKALKEMV
ncbi:DNA-binding protein [Solemya pervernicosa gill symbiont]|uniref:Viral histone-like protein n=2 Tax=Gammaproteobacteria incertae sedis TaxID=118884 RepID=A0A1T2L225_9GAMM|nr:HU family DNA-binding protein [Candidatus Reidiella endopervernicosa]OOZ39158.1 DNA-binding protein [Solemya pervernicosa gill symbiont]QKQ28016.1 HU family DNA-binding protein [Candidatus Reidiella endopervernicosa]